MRKVIDIISAGSLVDVHQTCRWRRAVILSHTVHQLGAGEELYYKVRVLSTGKIIEVYETSVEAVTVHVDIDSLVAI